MDAVKFILMAIILIAIGITFSAVFWFIFWGAIVVALIYATACWVGSSFAKAIKQNP